MGCLFLILLSKCHPVAAGHTVMTIGLQFDQIGIRGPISAAPPVPSLPHSFPPSFVDNFSLLDFVHRSIINEKMPLQREKGKCRNALSTNRLSEETGDWTDYCIRDEKAAE